MILLRCCSPKYVKKVAAVESIFGVMVEELVLVSFFTLFQKIILILVNTIEDLEDIFLAELIEVNPLRGSSCPLLWTVLSLKKVLVALKKVQIWANWS